MKAASISGLDARLATRLAARFSELRLNSEYVARNVERSTSLKLALTARREAQLSDEPVALALRLLLCGGQLSPNEIERALGPELAATALAAGLVHPHRPAPFHLRIASGLYLLSDYLDAGAPPDAVMGAGETTAILWRAARPGRRLGTALDLGCGAGTLALLLAAHTSHVTGTDVNPRAVEMARFNAALNGIGNVEFRTGSIFEPVGTARFDLIVSQPPYYPRPKEASLTFLHGGERGDEICRAILSGIPDRLHPGGRALIFSSWPEDSWPLHVPAHDTFALSVARRELPAAEQSLVTIEQGEGWHARVHLAPECWGDVTAGDIDRFVATERWLRSPQYDPRELRRPAAAHVFEEGGVRLVSLPLFGLAPVNDAAWTLVNQPQSATRQEARQAIERGLLEWSGYRRQGQTFSAGARAEQKAFDGGHV